LGSSFLRDESGFIGNPSGDQQNDEKYKLKAKALMEKASDTYNLTLHQDEYGMPHAAETILKNILRNLIELGLTNRKNLEKVLQFLPQNPEYFSE